jgi:hypothetical protein
MRKPTQREQMAYATIAKLEAEVSSLKAEITAGQGVADPRLVAVAPQLLQSLTNLVGLARLGAANLSKYHAALADAEAIIAKATA